MSCEECEKIQASDKSAFYRWRTANIEIRGCVKHLREIFGVLSFFQKASRLGKVGLMLHPGSWQNIFDCIRNSKIKSEGNFWASIQEVERQFDEMRKPKGE
jgi:hypothetical protein